MILRKRNYVAIKNSKQNKKCLGFFDEIRVKIGDNNGAEYAESLYFKGFQRFVDRLRVPYGSPNKNAE